MCVRVLLVRTSGYFGVLSGVFRVNFGVISVENVAFLLQQGTVNRCNAVFVSSQIKQWNTNHRHDDGHDGQGRAQGAGDRYDGYHNSLGFDFLSSLGGV